MIFHPPLNALQHSTTIHITIFRNNGKWSEKRFDPNHFQHSSSLIQNIAVYQIQSISIDQTGRQTYGRTNMPGWIQNLIHIHNIYIYIYRDVVIGLLHICTKESVIRANFYLCVYCNL